MRRSADTVRPTAVTACPITWPPKTCPPGCGEDSPWYAATVAGVENSLKGAISRRSSRSTRPAAIVDGSVCAELMRPIVLVAEPTMRTMAADHIADAPDLTSHPSQALDIPVPVRWTDLDAYG